MTSGHEGGYAFNADQRGGHTDPKGTLTLTGITYAEAVDLISGLWGECMWGPEGGARTVYPSGRVKAAFRYGD
jgi:hypothetical protein